MNVLKTAKQVAAISALVEGSSVRSVERMTGIHRDTILRLMVRVGTACERLMDETMRDLPCTDVQLDEQWTFVGKKQRRLGADDDPSRKGVFWIWSAIDRETKVVPCHRIGKRTREDANAFVCDVASRLRNRVQLSADGLNLYVEAVEAGFGGAVDFGQIVKSYEAEPLGPGRYSPPRVSSTEKTAVVGDPDQARICTSHIERLHLLNRMRCRRLTRLVDAYSKKLENLKAAISLHYAVYNFVNRHGALKVTPAMAAGVARERLTIEDLVRLA